MRCFDNFQMLPMLNLHIISIADKHKNKYLYENQLKLMLYFK